MCAGPPSAGWVRIWELRTTRRGIRPVSPTRGDFLERSVGPVALDGDAAHMAAVPSVVEERVVLDAPVVPHRHRPR